MSEASHALVLIGNHKDRTLTATRVEQLRDELADQAIAIGATTWLAESEACDLPLRDADAGRALEIARASLRGSAIDAAIVSTAARRKKLLVADMESTIIENEMLDELADFLGLREHIAAITARAMNGEIDFAVALRERVGLLRDLPVPRLDEAAKRIRYMSGGRELVATMHANGAWCALVSGGFSVFTALVRAHVGFDEDRANRLLEKDGKLIGTVAEPILGREAKLATLQELAAKRRLSLADCLAVGDGANDLPMLQAAGLGVAFHAKPNVAAASRICVDHGDLRALLYLQGYRSDEIVT